MPYFEIDTHSGVLGFDVKDNSAKLSAVRGRDVRIEIPATVMMGEQEYPVVEISRKAFLSHKYIREVVVPDSIKKIGDWGFAYCSNLEIISLPPDIVLENGVFKECFSLEQVYITEKNPRDNMEDTSFLLAAVIKLLDDRFLFDLKLAGSEEWLANWDSRMRSIIAEPDDEGFIALLACGEEDYEGKDNTLESYVSDRRKRKVRIAFVRLLHKTGLSDADNKLLIDYIYAHRPGATYEEDLSTNYTDDGHMGRMHLSSGINSMSAFSSGTVNKAKNNLLQTEVRVQDESWRVVLEEHGDEETYYQLLFDCGCIDKTTRDIMLADMGERHTRMKAFLLRLDVQGTGDSETGVSKQVLAFYDELEL